MADKIRKAIEEAILEVEREAREHGRSRRLSLTQTKLQEAFMWWDAPQFPGEVSR